MELYIVMYKIDELVQEWYNSSALAMELRISCTNPSICMSHVICVIAHHTFQMRISWNPAVYHWMLFNNIIS